MSAQTWSRIEVLDDESEVETTVVIRYGRDDLVKISRSNTERFLIEAGYELRSIEETIP